MAMAFMGYLFAKLIYSQAYKISKLPAQGFLTSQRANNSFKADGFAAA
ncbi:MAG: hypothetical protein HOQ10_06045 [Frateuria sp.]|nr:hypothetical protein [Frateuria sp.]NUO72260.1 hypothetical protein [Frateuria sp.]NUR22709.1 hypothetical protein [Frateuria sp.]